MSTEVTNSNLISSDAPPALKKKAQIFMPHPSEIETPAASLRRPPRSGVGKGAGKTTSRDRYKK